MTVSNALKHLQPLMPEEVAKWRRSLPMIDAETRRLLEQHILTTARMQLGEWESKILLPPPPANRSRGEVRLGSVTYDSRSYPFGLSRAELLQGTSIFGRSGAGKTNVVFTLVQQLQRRSIPFLFLDWKRTCRHLLPRLTQSVNFYTPGRALSPFAFNPFIPPPGIDLREYITRLVDTLSSAYTLGDGAKSLLQKALRRAYDEASPWPNQHDVLRLLEETNADGRAIGWKASAVRALQSLVLAGDDREGQADQLDLVQLLLGQSTIIELDGLGENTKKFLIPMLMQWLFSYRIQTRDREDLRLVIVIEEAHHLLYRQENRGQETVMNQMLRQCRELGIGIVVVDQHPHLISSAALGNAYASICLNLREPTDLNRAAALSLLAEDEKRYLTMLPVGEAIVKLQDRWPQPFLVRFDEVPIQKGVMTDDVFRRLLGRKAAHSGVKPGALPSLARIRRVRVADGRVSEDGWRLLLDCSRHPSDGVRARYVRLGFSMDKGTRLKTQLVDAGLASTTEIAVGKTRRLIVQPTEYARKILKLDARPSLGSMEHEFWKYHYAEKFKSAGFEVQVEAARHAGRVDVFARTPSESVGVEIETGKSDVVRNVANGLRSRFDLVLVVATSEAARAKVERQLAGKDLLIRGRVRVVLRDEYVPRDHHGVRSAA